MAIYRKRGNTIAAEPPVVWLCSKQYDISHTHRERYDMHTINLKLNMKGVHEIWHGSIKTRILKTVIYRVRLSLNKKFSLVSK